MRISRCLILLSVSVLGLCVPSLFAQNSIMRQQSGDSPLFGMRYLRPSFNWGADMSTFSGTFDLYCDVPVSSKISIVGDFPFSAFSFKWRDSESGVGNVYLGFRNKMGSPERSFSSVELGMWLPTASEDENDLNALSIYGNYHELQRFIPNYVTVASKGSYHYRGGQGQGGMISIEAGPELLIPTDDNQDTQLFVFYGISGGYYTPDAVFLIGFEGLYLATADTDDWGLEDKWAHYLVLGAHLVDTKVRPGLFYMLPFDKDTEEVIDGTFGISFEVDIR
jgi:hypothetical protein